MSDINDEPMDEDALNRQKPEAPVKRRRGRPKGSKVKAGDDLQTKIDLALVEFVEAQLAVMRGELVSATGPSGKPFRREPSMKERQDAAQWLADNKHLVEKQTAAAPAEPDTDTPTIEQMRNAVRDAIGLRRTKLSEVPRNEDGTISILEEADFEVDPVDGGHVISANADEIKRFDAGDRTIKNSAAPKRNIETDPRLGDRLELGAGHYALFLEQRGSGKKLWYLFNGVDDHSHFALKDSAELAKKHFWENTSAGLALAKKGEKP